LPEELEPAADVVALLTESLVVKWHVGHFFQAARQLLEPAIDQGQEDLFLALEVKVKGPPRDARRLDDVRDRRVPVTFPGEHGGRRLQNLLSPCLSIQNRSHALRSHN